MKLKHLESAVQCVEPFRAPNIELEQYATSPHLAARMIFTAHGMGDIAGKRVCDLGCGCGMLSICAVIMGSATTTGVDIDPTAIEIAAQNCESIGVDMDFVLHDVPSLKVRDERCMRFDTAIMNPPFGTRTHGIDMQFVRAGLALAERAVYSLHQSSTREFILKKAKQWGVEAVVLAQMRFDLPQTYKFHKEKSKDIAVDMIRFVKPSAHVRVAPPLPPPAPSKSLAAGDAGAGAAQSIPPDHSVAVQLEQMVIVATTNEEATCSAGAALFSDAADTVTEHTACSDECTSMAMPAQADGEGAHEPLYDCENECGFFGTFAVVAEHERSCTFEAPTSK